MKVRDRRKADAADDAQHSAYVKATVRTSAQEQLDALITEYGYGLSFFERWQKRGVRSAGELTRQLKQIDSENSDDGRHAYQLKLDYLREQIEMRTRGLRWVQFAAKWSSLLDGDVGTVEQLTGHVKEIILEERDRREAGTCYPPPPPARRRHCLPHPHVTPHCPQVSFRNRHRPL